MLPVYDSWLVVYKQPLCSPFSFDWWMWLSFTGFSIGCVTRLVLGALLCSNRLPLSSVKLVGLLVTALVGLYTIEDLWHKYGDLRLTMVSPTFAYRTDNNLQLI